MEYLVLDKQCTQKEFARVIGITQQAVSDLVTRGVLGPNDPLGEWIQAYCMHLRVQAAGRASTGPLDLTQERAKLAREQSQLAALKRAEAQGQLCRVEDVEKEAFEQARAAREIIMSIPDRLAPVIAAEHDAAKVHKMLSGEIDQVCRQLGGEAE